MAHEQHDDVAAAFASMKVFSKQRRLSMPGMAGNSLAGDVLSEVVSNFGQRAADLTRDLFHKHTRSDPFAVPDVPEPISDEEVWHLERDSRDQDGEQKVMELANIINSVNQDREMQGLERVYFKDPYFPPDASSLFADPAVARATQGSGQVGLRRDLGDLATKVGNLDNVKWLRPHEFGDPNLVPTIYSGGVDPDDVGQGILGNCYFLAAISSTAADHDDGLVKDLCIENPEVAACGMYGIKFFLNGKWVTVLVDDMIPCKYEPRTGFWEPIFAKPMKHQKQATGEKEIWALIFEKAWAKLNLSYEATDGGDTADTTNYLTGGTITQHTTDEIDENPKLWNQIHAIAETKRAFMSCTIGPNHAETTLQQYGLFGGHAYSVLDVRQAGGNKFIHVRNPWGDHNEWKGRFSDKSRDWTPQLKAELGWTDQNDGAFWMLWQDFHYFFNKVEICNPLAIAQASGAHEGDPNQCRVDWFKSHWIRGLTAGGPQRCKTFKHNPVCCMRVNTSGTVRLAIYQPDVRPIAMLPAVRSADAKPLCVNLYIKDAASNQWQLLIDEDEVIPRRHHNAIFQAQAGREYHIVATAWAPGVQCAFSITAAGGGATLYPGPSTQPTQAEQQLMMIETPRSLCCVVCHEDGDMYVSPEGIKCARCRNTPALSGKGRSSKPLPSAVPTKSSSQGYANANGGYANGGYGNGGYANGNGGYQQPQTQPQAQPQVQPQQQPQQQPQAPPQQQPQRQQEAQVKCYYCQKGIAQSRSQNTQYGRACNPGCWLGGGSQTTTNAANAANTRPSTAKTQTRPATTPQNRPASAGQQRSGYGQPQYGGYGQPQYGGYGGGYGGMMGYNF